MLTPDQSRTENAVVALVAARSRAPIRERYTQVLKSIGEPLKLLNGPINVEDFAAVSALLCHPLRISDARKDLKRWEEQGIFAVALGDPQYPLSLTEIYDPPVVLFYRGRSPAEWPKFPMLAIVGSRRADPVATDFAAATAELLSRNENCVVSGLALGVDTAAHLGAIRGSGECPTLAVLGGGLAKIYPAQNTSLARQIVETGGALISQFEPEVPPLPHQFLDRNRVVAGLSTGVLVIQAAKRSGSLATARFALESGREVLAVPGAVNDPRYQGSNSLLRQGAQLVGATEHIFEIIPSLKRPGSQAADNSFWSKLPEAQRKILVALGNFPAVLYDDLREALAVPGFATHLLELELAGYLLRLPGNEIGLSQAGVELVRGSGANESCTDNDVKDTENRNT